MAKIVPKRTIEEIRFAADIADVVGSYITLKKAGGGFKGLCPFHKEKTPSFTVNPQRQIFHCFGCGEGGDVFKFIMLQEAVDFTSAIRILADRTGVHVELEEGSGDSGVQKDVLYRIHEGICSFYQRCLLETAAGKRARDYLKGRELNDETIEKFKIGFAPKRWDACLKWAAKHKFKTDDMELAGLILRKEKDRGYGDYYDRFRDRVMFPIQDEQGRIIGFSGRALEKDVKGAKYVNSPETPLFRKSRVLFAMDKARRPIVDAREALICEGQIDVIRCHQAGIDTAVASQGTAFTDDHARILKRYADSVVLAFDPDKAGREATVRTARIFMQAGLAVKAATLPDDEDPDSYIQTHGGDAFREIMASAESAVAFQIHSLAKHEDLTREVGTMRAAKAVLETVMSSPNAVQRARLVQEAATLLNIPASALQDDLRAMTRRQTQRARWRKEHDEQRDDTRPARVERPREEVELCGHMVHVVDAPALAELVDNYLPLELITDEDCRTLVRLALQSLDSGEDLQALLQASDPDHTGTLLPFSAQVLMAPVKVAGREFSHEHAVRDLILRIWRRHMDRERAAISTDVPTPENIERLAQITYHLNRLRMWDTGAPIIELAIEEMEEG